MDFRAIEIKWQKRWAEKKVFVVNEDSKKKKFYCLEMFPYPSGSGLHMGHAFNYTLGDIYARFKRMSGFNVLYPMGYDSLGLPAENAAIKAGLHPKTHIEAAIKYFVEQQKYLGLSYDWSRIVRSHEPEFYKWDQWIFLKMFEHGLAYRKKAPVNWCPKCSSVLANEQVHNGKCWRHKETDAEIRHLEQWFFKITDYAEELYEMIEQLKSWPEDVKAMQKNWIGKSQGTEIFFEINGKIWPIFTTRPDTIFGVTFMVISAQHPKLVELVTDKQKKEVDEFLRRIKSTSEKDMDALEKEGVFTGSFATNPVTGEKVPVYAGNFVIADYGCGMVMAVPCHDQRDFEFAKKYKIPMKIVIQPRGYELKLEKISTAFVDEGRLVNSGGFSGSENKDAIAEISIYLEKKNIGKRVVQYKLRDWLISRQRYWGTPIPVIYCDRCGIIPVPEDELPVTLPEDVTFGEGNPIITSKQFVNTRCPKCKGNARRETDTMDTFVNSSWYFLRYCDPKNDKEIFDKKKAKYWMPVDLYIGGKEHACMHLIYSRFYTKFLRDIGLLDFDEPAVHLFNQGMIHGDDGYVMSKSRGNVIDPLETCKKYSADILRFYLVSAASPDKDIIWCDTGIEGSMRFISKVVNYFENVRIGKSDSRIESKVNKAIKDITEDIELLRYNLAVIKIRKLFEEFGNEESKAVLEISLKLLHPFCPHLTEELWEKFGNSGFISTANWPGFDASKIDDKAEALETAVKMTISDIKSVILLSKIEQPKKITLFVAEQWKCQFMHELRQLMQETRDAGKIIKIMIGGELKKHGKDIAKYVPRFVKNPSLIPAAVFGQDEECNALLGIAAQLETEFCCTVKITKEQDSYELKAHHAMPGKPAIVVE